MHSSIPLSIYKYHNVLLCYTLNTVSCVFCLRQYKVDRRSEIFTNKSQVIYILLYVCRCLNQHQNGLINPAFMYPTPELDNVKYFMVLSDLALVSLEFSSNSEAKYTGYNGISGIDTRQRRCVFLHLPPDMNIITQTELNKTDFKLQVRQQTLPCHLLKLVRGIPFPSAIHFNSPVPLSQSTLRPNPFLKSRDYYD